MTTRIRSTRRLAAVSVAALMVLGACGSDEASTADEPIAETGAPAGSGTEAVTTDPSTPVVETAPVAVEGAALAPFADAAADPAVGVATPVVTGQSFDGSEVSIGGAGDGPSLLVFLAHWCPHCNDEIPELNELRDAGTLPADLEVVGISTAVNADAPNYPPSEWTVEKDWTWPMMADSEASDAIVAFGGQSFPYMVLVDADGTVLARQSGTSSAADIQSWIESALA